MLSAVSRSSYICLQCRSRILQNVRPRPLRHHLLAASHRTLSSTARGYRPVESQGGAPGDSDDMAHLVSNFMQNAFGTGPPRPAPGIGKISRDAVSDKTLPDTWKGVGLRSVLADTLVQAYPSASRPTAIQKRILMGLSGGNSIAVRYLPGTGKSFAITVWALGLERAMRRDVDWQGCETWKPTTTAFIFVPTADLGMQYYTFIQRILQNSSSEVVRSSLNSVVQFLCRRLGEDEETEQLRLLSEYPNPHIVIATPAIALDMLSDRKDKVRNLLDFTEMRALVVDEIDAAIAKVHYLSTLRSQKVDRSQPRVTETPIETLLNYIFRRRKAEELGRKRAAIQPQLILPTATLSTSQIYKFITKDHPDWLGQPDPRSVRDVGPFRTSKAANLLPIGDENSEMNKIVRAVADNIKHHVVAYDISSGFMRDAPVPRMEGWQDEAITDKLNELREFEISKVASKRQARGIRRGYVEGDVGTKDTTELASKRAGYPPDIAVEAFKKLLEHDNWPKNAIAAIGVEAGIRHFLGQCAQAGIDARELKLEDWNRNAEEEGRLPIGRTDMLFDPEVRKRLKYQSENTSKGGTTVWVSTAPALRGLDVPGIYHLYILHRLIKARDYTTYCGRVARWPIPALSDDLKDPRAGGSQKRRGVGKVVSLLLEDHVVPAGGVIGQGAPGVITNDGSDNSKWVWLEEGLTLAKIGCFVHDYYGERGNYPCGPEVSLLESKPQREPLASLDDPFSILDAAFSSPKELAKKPTEGSPGVSLHQPVPEESPQASLSDFRNFLDAAAGFPEEPAAEPAGESSEVALNQRPREESPPESSSDPLGIFDAVFGHTEGPALGLATDSPEASLRRPTRGESPAEFSNDPLGIFSAVFDHSEEPPTEPTRESPEASLRRPEAKEGPPASRAEPLSFPDLGALGLWGEEGEEEEEAAAEEANGPPLEVGQVEQQGSPESKRDSIKEGKGEEGKKDKPAKKAKKKKKEKPAKAAKPKKTENKGPKKGKNAREKSTRKAKKDE